ncbi:MAG: LPS export ABC transporter periplasmic protein LptC [Rhodocyclaceae bacterium]|jgi:lipopolysaccharide export system protein LptC|nr:LPS export ABC transporter periplasmic protein LptC [Rhodocyclaceae bacterium]
MAVPVDRLYPLIAIAALAAATVWLERVATGENDRPAADVRIEPDFIGAHIRMVSFKEDGRQHYELLADRIIHHPVDDRTEFENPRITYVRQDLPLTIRARHGESIDKGEQVFLTGNVQVFRDAAKEDERMHLDSDSLTLWPKEERAESSDPVAVRQGSTSAHADGMVADNLGGSLLLKGNTRVTIPRSTRNPS